jgi:hypothetical protein
MRNILTFLSIFILLLSCRHDKWVDAATRDFVWKDLDSLTNHSKDYKIYYLDSSWLERRSYPLDSNFIKTNLFLIDHDLNTGIKPIGPGFKYEFYLLDTLKKENFGYFILVIEKYSYSFSPSMCNEISLLILTFSGDKVLSSFCLAKKENDYIRNYTKTSVILSNYQIISRTVIKWSSDMINDNIKNCGWGCLTEFNAYDSEQFKYVQYKKPIEKDVEYKLKIN